MTSTEASSSEEKAATLRALHVPGDPLVLPNAWDAASARMVEAAGRATGDPDLLRSGEAQIGPAPPRQVRRR